MHYIETAEANAAREAVQKEAKQPMMGFSLTREQHQLPACRAKPTLLDALATLCMLIQHLPQHSSSTWVSPVLLCAPAEALLQNLFSPIWVQSQLLQLAQSCIPFLQVVALQGLICRTSTNPCCEGAHCGQPASHTATCLQSAALDRAVHSSLLVNRSNSHGALPHLEQLSLP